MKLRELHITQEKPDEIFKILRYLQVSLPQKQFKGLTLYLGLDRYSNSFEYDDEVIWERNLLPRQIIIDCNDEYFKLKDV